MILKEPPNHTATPNYHSRASGNPVLTRGIWIPACAGMTIYSRCVDTYALRGERSEGGEAGGDEGRGPRMRQRQNYVFYLLGHPARGCLALASRFFAFLPSVTDLLPAGVRV